MNTVYFHFLLIAVSFSIHVPAAAQSEPRPPAVFDSRIGVAVQDTTAPVRSAFGSPGEGGALTTAVEQGSAGYVAGVQVGDIFIEVDGQGVRNVREFGRLLDRHAPGTRLEVSVWRQPYSVPLTIVVPALGEKDEKPQPRSPPRSTEVAGIVASELAMADRCRLGVESGLLVERVSGAGAEAGIRPGDVILMINTTPLTNIAEFYAQARQQAGRIAALLVHQGERARYLAIRWPAVAR